MDNQSLQEQVKILRDQVDFLLRERTVDKAMIQSLSLKLDKDDFSDTWVINKKVIFKSMLKFGLSTSKMGFFGAEPVVQQTQVTTPSGGATVDSQARTSIGQIKTILTNLGLTT